jgi:hypothetical protein
MILRSRFRRAKRRAAGAAQRQGVSRFRGCIRCFAALKRSKNEMHYAKLSKLRK